PVGAEETEQTDEELHRRSTLEAVPCFAGAAGGKKKPPGDGKETRTQVGPSAQPRGAARPVVVHLGPAAGRPGARRVAARSDGARSVDRAAARTGGPAGPGRRRLSAALAPAAGDRGADVIEWPRCRRRRSSSPATAWSRPTWSPSRVMACPLGSRPRRARRWRRALP